MTTVDIAAAYTVSEGALTPVAVGVHRLLLTRIEGRVYAISERCPHLGFSMARGTVSGTAIRCPWHGSTFDCRTGQNLDWVCAFAGIPMPRWSHAMIALGKRPTPVQTFEVEERAGRLFVAVPGDE